MATAWEVHDVPCRRRYQAERDAEVAGFLLYRRRPGTIRLIHTEVDPRFEGRGLGSALARAALGAARTAGDGVEVVCPFVAGWLERHPEYRDVLAPRSPAGP
jgi:uncharacterized protein